MRIQRDADHSGHVAPDVRLLSLQRQAQLVDLGLCEESKKLRELQDMQLSTDPSVSVMARFADGTCEPLTEY
jgi:hypothetical protein